MTERTSREILDAIHRGMKATWRRVDRELAEEKRR